MRKLPAGLAQAQRAMELANEDATMEMEHRTTYLATVGTLGPMIGLVGTVYGMIMAFRVIAPGGLVAPGQPARRGDLDGALRHARGDRAVDPGDLLLRAVPQPDRAAVAGGGDDRPSRCSSSSRRACGCGAGPIEPGPPPHRRRRPPHAHPFAVSAALAARPPCPAPAAPASPRPASAVARPRVELARPSSRIWTRAGLSVPG